MSSSSFKGSKGVTIDQALAPHEQEVVREFFETICTLARLTDVSSRDIVSKTMRQFWEETPRRAATRGPELIKQKKKRRELKLQGICVDCETEPVAPESTARCVECFYKQRELLRVWREKHRASEQD